LFSFHSGKFSVELRIKFLQRSFVRVERYGEVGVNTSFNRWVKKVSRSKYCSTVMKGKMNAIVLGGGESVCKEFANGSS